MKHGAHSTSLVVFEVVQSQSTDSKHDSEVDFVQNYPTTLSEKHNFFRSAIILSLGIAQCSFKLHSRTKASQK